MPLTRDFKETVTADLRRDRAYRAAYLAEAIESMYSGEVPVGKRMLRQYINGTLGFDALSMVVGSPATVLMRALSDNGNPRVDKLFDILGRLLRVDRVKIRVVPAAKSRRQPKGS